MHAYTFAYSVCVILVGWLFVCVCVCARVCVSSVSMMAYVNIYLGLNIHDDYVFRSARVRIFIRVGPMFLLTSPRVMVLRRVLSIPQAAVRLSTRGEGGPPACAFRVAAGDRRRTAMGLGQVWRGGRVEVLEEGLRACGAMGAEGSVW